MSVNSPNPQTILTITNPNIFMSISIRSFQHHISCSNSYKLFILMYATQLIKQIFNHHQFHQKPDRLTL